MRSITSLWIPALAALACLSPISSAKGAPSGATPLDRVVHVVCDKDVVFLGEDGQHAAVATIDVKLRLVQRLVSECSFKGLVFENQFYDMLDYQHAVTAGTATREQLVHAFSAKWSSLSAYDPVIDWVFAESSAGHLRVAGMDPNALDAGSRYAGDRLPTVLTSVLSGRRHTECTNTMNRHQHWSYDDVHPFDAAELDRLRSCLRDIRAKLKDAGQPARKELRAMADSYATYLDFTDGADDSGAVRDHGMFENLTRIRTRWPKGTRVVVWCATVHAAKVKTGDYRPTGSYVFEALGPRMAAIGFSALAGSYGNVGGRGLPNPLPAATGDSLEARAFAGDTQSAMRYVDHEQLKAMGNVSARAFSYRGAAQKRDWSKVLDGIIVLRHESAARAKP